MSYAIAATEKMENYSQKLSSWNDHSGNLEDAYHNRPLRCYAFVMEGGTCVRANNLYSYCDLNKQIPRLMASLAPHFEYPLIHPNCKIGPKAQVNKIVF